MLSLSLHSFLVAYHSKRHRFNCCFFSGYGGRNPRAGTQLETDVLGIPRVQRSSYSVGHVKEDAPGYDAWLGSQERQVVDGGFRVSVGRRCLRMCGSGGVDSEESAARAKSVHPGWVWGLLSKGLLTGEAQKSRDQCKFEYRPENERAAPGDERGSIFPAQDLALKPISNGAS